MERTANSLSRFIMRLNAAFTASRIYFPGHPQVSDLIGDSFAQLQRLLQARAAVQIYLIDERLVVEGTVLHESDRHVAQFIEVLKEKGIHQVRFLSSATQSELAAFVTHLASRDPSPLRSQAGIRLGKAEPATGKIAHMADPNRRSQEKLEHFRALHEEKLDELRTICQHIRSGEGVNIRGVEDMAEALIQRGMPGMNPLIMLADLKSSDEYTFTHSINVCILATRLGEVIGFNGDELRRIGVAALLHDTGKLFIPNEIFTKPGPLTPAERAVVETHPIRGARYILSMKGVPRLAVVAALEHHIGYDGSGYPRFRQPWHPNIVSQMITVSDVFDAMRTRRVYQEPLAEHEIAGILKQHRGKAYHPALVDRFLELIQR